MDSVPFERVCVLLDHPAPPYGALSHAQEWASRLDVPLDILTLSSITGDSVDVPDQGIRPEDLRVVEPSSIARELFQPGGLSVFSEALPARIKNRLLHSSLYSGQNAVLVCSGAYAPVSRVLILNATPEGAHGFLAAALSVCQLFELVPVILTVARTETQARRRQQLAEELCLVHRIAAIHDYVVGLDVGVAVNSIARWRRCSHVFVARRQAIPWWRWMRGDTLKELLDLADSLTFLALPESGFRLRTDAAPSQENSEHLVTP
jgi:hypothetical protein